MLFTHNYHLSFTGENEKLRKKTILKDTGVFLAVTLVLLTTNVTVIRADTTQPGTTSTLMGDYSSGVDMADNIEKTKNTSFIIKESPVNITFKPGFNFGVVVTMKNNATEPITNIKWNNTMNLSRGLFLFGGTKNGTIASLAPGESVTIRVVPLGFCHAEEKFTNVIVFMNDTYVTHMTFSMIVLGFFTSILY